MNTDMFGMLDGVGDFDPNKLSGKGDFILVLKPYFVARKNKDGAVVELKGHISWVGADEDKHYLDAEYTCPIFFDPTRTLSIKQLFDFCGRSGTDYKNWGSPDQPLKRDMVPGFLKLCAWQQQYVLFKVKKGEKGNFANLHAVVRVHPQTGETIEGALPETVPNALIREALETRLEGEGSGEIPF